MALCFQRRRPITASSIQSGQASQHYNHIILDDPINEKTAQSETMVATALELYVYLESLLTDWATSTFTVVGTPYGRGDVIEFAMENEVKQGERLFWRIGARGEFDMSQSLKDSPMAKSLTPVYTEGEPIFPEHCPERVNWFIWKSRNLKNTIYSICVSPMTQG